MQEGGLEQAVLLRLQSPRAHPLQQWSDSFSPKLPLPVALGRRLSGAARRPVAEQGVHFTGAGVGWVRRVLSEPEPSLEPEPVRP